jgi:pyruvate kinase
MRRTKIVCTIGPKSSSPEMLLGLVRAGMNVARLNMSHGTYEWHGEVIDNLKAIQKQGYNIGIMLDTKGPEIRSSDLPSPIEIVRGTQLTITIEKMAVYPANTVGINYDGFLNDVDVGDVILVDSGLMSLVVTGKTSTEIMTEVIDGGMLGSRRHLNIRGKSAQLPTLTEKDWQDIEFGIQNNVDYFALSFVNDSETVISLHKYLETKKCPIKIISKLESTDAVTNMKEIIEASDAIMVARGDLGAELPVEDVPLAQLRMVEYARKIGKPVIVATQLLESMMTSPTPTRAEVSDIFTAVRQQADAIMLSGETANGLYPLKAVEIMNAVALKAESTYLSDKAITVEHESTIKSEMALGASVVSNNIDADGLLVYSTSGDTARLVAQCRPNSPLYTFTGDDVTTRQLSLVWGVNAFTLPFNDVEPDKTLSDSIAILVHNNRLSYGNKVVTLSHILTASGEIVHATQIRNINA